MLQTDYHNTLRPCATYANPLFAHLFACFTDRLFEYLGDVQDEFRVIIVLDTVCSHSFSYRYRFLFVLHYNAY